MNSGALNSIRTGVSRFGRFALVGTISLLATVVAVSDDETVFVQMSDTQLGLGGYDHDVAKFKESVEEINALGPDFTIICGDLVETRTDVRAFNDFVEIKAGFLAPCHAAPGNHDVGFAPLPEDLKRYRELVGADYFSFEHDNFTFVIANTQLWLQAQPDEVEKHNAWFVETLKAAREGDRRIIVAGHFPPFTKSPDEAGGIFNLPHETRQWVLDQCETYGVEMYLAGHLHRNVRTEYKGMPIVITASTCSRNLSADPLGYRVWRTDESGTLHDTYVPLPSELLDE